jgi:hypothetical protein
MRTTSAIKLLYLMTAVSFLAVSGCILSPEEDPAPPPVEETYKPLTDKENLIYNLQQTYKFTNIDKYSELLHLDYIWYNQTEDVNNGAEPFLSRDTDISRTRNIFLAKNNQHPDPTKVIDRLELTITPAAWQQVFEIGGEACDDCWETTRQYDIQVVMDGGNKTLVGVDLIKFTVVPAERDGKKIYLIYRADDIKKP